MDESEKAEVWGVIEDCLVELHGLTREEARSRWQTLRRKMGEHSDPGVAEIFYHAEPLYVANDLAGAQLDDGAVDAQYRAIQARYWPELFPDIHVARPA